VPSTATSSWNIIAQAKRSEASEREQTYLEGRRQFLITLLSNVSCSGPELWAALDPYHDDAPFLRCSRSLIARLARDGPRNVNTYTLTTPIVRHHTRGGSPECSWRIECRPEHLFSSPIALMRSRLNLDVRAMRDKISSRSSAVAILRFARSCSRLAIAAAISGFLSSRDAVTFADCVAYADQNPLNQTGPIVKRRPIVNSEEADDDEEDQHQQS
jgi:hypothetical protein